MKTIIAIGLTLLICSVGQGQNVGRISGRATNNGTPLARATIILEANNKEIARTTTDSDGNYIFENLKKGSYMLSVHWDQGARWEAVRVDNQASVVDIDVGVALATQPIREYVSVSVGRSQPIEQVSKSVDVIDGQQMRDRADFALVESLRTVPGFRVQQLGGFGRTANIKTRGLRNQDTAVLIDGIRFRDAGSITGDASPFLSDLTLTSVGEVEVLRGSGSSLYGTNAIGGVIDFQTPTARRGTHGQLSGALGGLGLGRFRGNLSHGADLFGIGGGASRTVYRKGIDGNDDAENTNVQARFDTAPSPNTGISGRIFFSDADVKLNVNPDTFGTLPADASTIINALPGVNFTPDAEDPDARQASRFFNGQITATRVVRPDLVITGWYQGLKTRRRNDDGALGPGFQSAFTSIFEGRIDTANARFDHSRTKNALTGGYEFERERFLNEGGTPNPADAFWTRAGQRSHTFYIQNIVRLLGGNFQLAGGFRAQRYALGQPRFSLTNAPYSGVALGDPPAALTFDGAVSHYFRRTGTKLRAHVGNGYRVPSLYERFGSFFSTFGTPSFVALGDPSLKPERSIAFDAGVEQYLSKEKVRMSATYFYTRLTDIIGFGNVVPPIGSTPRPFGGYENQKGGIARGAEFSLKMRPGNSTDVTTSYTFTNSDQRTPPIAGSGIVRSFGIPDHQFTLVATQRFGRLWVNFDFLATSVYLAPVFSTSTFNTYIYRFKGNRRGDLTAGYTFNLGRGDRTLRVYGTVENLFDQEYFENGFRTVGRTGRVGLTFGF